MNHTQRIEETARQYRHLTRKVAKEAIETYLALLAEDIASGEWVEIPGIGKIQVVKEKGAGRLMAILPNGKRIPRSVGVRLRTRIRLTEQMKSHCYKSI
ncbi:MAG: HU family DNA-binding protein [Anaerolineae bacterium]|nr:HU family DNA-binding protein [Anaerolineae bacterium]